MWLRFLCLSACLVMCKCDVLTIENLLNNHFATIKKLKECTHESGEKARCTKKSICSLEEKPEPEKPSTDPTLNFIYRDVASGDDCTFIETCCPESKIITPSKPAVPKPIGCGFSFPGGSALRSVIDKYGYADYGEFPWTVALLKTKDRSKINFKTDYIGGGTLIHPSVVLTVAHKVHSVNVDELVIRAGEWNSSSEQELNVYQERNVNSITKHPDFLLSRAHNDVALLILKTPFDLNNAHHIDVACLERTLPPAGTRCFGTGWGRDFNVDGQNASVLKKLVLPLVEGRACQNMYRNSQLGRTYELHQSLTCAGGERDVDTCVGDGGSPLMCSLPNDQGHRYSVVGLVAYGLECGTLNLPGVYAKIPHVYDWVVREMGKQGFNKTFEYTN